MTTETINNLNSVTGTIYAIDEAETIVSRAYSKKQLSLKVENGEKIWYPMFDFGNEKMDLIDFWCLKQGMTITILYSLKGKQPSKDSEGKLRGFSGLEVVEITHVHK